MEKLRKVIVVDMLSFVLESFGVSFVCKSGAEVDIVFSGLIENG
jgi:hypothetical protein